jgi:hypothetical protein
MPVKCPTVDPAPLWLLPAATAVAVHKRCTRTGACVRWEITAAYYIM